MMHLVVVVLGGLGVLGMAAAAHAQPLGTFRWQLQPFCNVVTLAITQNGGVFRLEGTDDQCGNGADQASAIGTAFQNPDGTIGFGLTLVVTPGGAPVHVDAALAPGALNGTWRDSAGNSGTFAFTPGAGSGGTARLLPSPVVPATIQLRPDGGLLATGQPGVGAIPATGPGSRMMWHPTQSAFRAGRVNLTVPDAWDDQNIGFGSTALGINSIASGFASFAAGDQTQATSDRSVALGFRSRATGFVSTAMGDDTTASGNFSTAMGQSTIASGRASTVMGFQATASGFGALASGVASVASGNTSLAAGERASAGGTGSVALGSFVSASTDGTFMFGDRSTTTPMLTFAPNQFLVRATGGTAFHSNAALTAGVKLLANESAWSSASDVNGKELFRDLAGDEVLAKLSRMSIQEWSYKAQGASIRHVGPTAQEFHAAFGLGGDPLRITTIDADGIALRGLQALEDRDRQVATAQASEIESMRQAMGELRAEVAELRALVAAAAGRQR